METIQSKSSKLKLDFKGSKYATGRRKTSVAKVWLKKGTGKFYVNGKNLDVELDFNNIVDLLKYFEQFNLNLSKKTLNSYLKSVSNP